MGLLTRRRTAKHKVEVETCTVSDERNAVESFEVLPPDEFLLRYRKQASESLCNAYLAVHPLHHSAHSGTVTSTLCEDVFSLVQVQLNVLDEYLVKSAMRHTDAGDSILLDGLLCIVRNIYYKHLHFRENFDNDIEVCCASANDFYRMMEKVEQLYSTLQIQYPHLGWNGNTKRSKAPSLNAKMAVLEHELTELLSLFGSDAVYAAQRAQSCVVRDMNQSAIPTKLFSKEWEDCYVNNEVAISLVKTIEEYLYDLHNYLCNELLYRKAVDALVRATVCFYIRCLVRRAERGLSKRASWSGGSVRKERAAPFHNPKRAVCRMMYDIQVIQGYFQNIVKEIPVLARVIEHELSVLTVVHECLSLASGSTTKSSSSLEDFVVLLHKRTGGIIEVTRHFLGDLWYLAAPPRKRREIFEAVALMQAELQMVSATVNEMKASPMPQNERASLQDLSLPNALREIYAERILQERASVCAPCVQAVRDLQSKRETKALVSAAENDAKTLVATRQNKMETDADYCTKFQAKFFEFLKLHNLRFIKDMQDACSTKCTI